MKTYGMAIAQRAWQPRTAFPIAKVTTNFLAVAAIFLSFSVGVNAQTVPRAENAREARVAQTDSVPAIVYLPDVQLQGLAPQEIRVTPTQPVTDAVGKILQAYQGQDVGIRGYDVQVNPSTHAAVINFKLNNPRGAEAFESMSSANQYALFEAIRQTLLSQPIYNIQEVIFTANGAPFDI